MKTNKKYYKDLIQAILKIKIILKELVVKIISYFRQCTKIANTKSISSRKSKGLFDVTIKPLNTANNSLSPPLEYPCKGMYVKFNGSCLR